MTMKRRLKLNIKYPLTTAREDIARNRGFEKPSDMRKAKRVRFENTEMDGAPVLASSGGCEATQSPRCGAPKTSEYAYFKKMKKGAVRGHSRALQKENEQLKNSKINYLVRETGRASDKLKPSTKDLNFSVSEEMAEPIDQNLFHSPCVSKYDESDRIRSKEQTNQIKKRSWMFSESVTPVGQSLFSSPLNEASEKSENKCSMKAIFSAKRRRLRQWAHSAFSEVEKLHPKGFDLVPLLLSRLFPKGSENNGSSKGDANNSSTVAVIESNNLENRRHLSFKRDWDNDDLPKSCSGRQTDTVLAERDGCISGFPFNLKENHFQDEFMDPDQRSKSHIYRSSQAPLGFPFCLPFDSYKSSGSSHDIDMNEIGSIIEHRREPYRLLLEWDNELGNDRVSSSIVNHDKEKNICTRLANSWNVNQQRIVDNVLDANMCPSSLFSNYYLQFNKLPNYSSNGCLMRDFGPIFDDVKCATAEPGQFPLALPCTPKCITLGEDKNGENMPSSSNIISSEDWFKEEVWDGKPQSKFWWNCLPTPEDNPSVFHPLQLPKNENCLYSFSRLKDAPWEEPFNPRNEGEFNRYYLSPILQSSLDSFINRPLLLDHVSEDIPDQELYFDDCGDELGYRKLH